MNFEHTDIIFSKTSDDDIFVPKYEKSPGCSHCDQCEENNINYYNGLIEIFDDLL
jgi:hypothetical protein